MRQPDHRRLRRGPRLRTVLSRFFDTLHVQTTQCLEADVFVLARAIGQFTTGTRATAVRSRAAIASFTPRPCFFHALHIQTA